jgi:hypothetical protein
MHPVADADRSIEVLCLEILPLLLESVREALQKPRRGVGG